MPNTAALVLAGGRSRRMGRDKALLPLPEPQTNLLQQVCTVTQACVSRTYVLTPWPERYNHFLPPTITLLPEPTVGQGPLVALATGWSMILQDCQRYQRPAPDWLLVLACDMPALDVPTLQKWRQKLKGMTIESGDEIAALPKHEQRWEPLCGFYHRRCIPSLENALANNIRSFQQWLINEDKRVIALPMPDHHMLRNCNTPKQWQQFLDESNHRNP